MDDKNKDKIIESYQWAINRIDDYFEYQYKTSRDSEEIKNEICNILNSLTNRLKSTINGN